ncbi:MAG TPA: formylglycine-generating enzyme family protein [Cyanobacteria bacterium UBA8803]|nr:formylglycine-generating enzyme family protein [Cyanobacteria bacterium UBA9273]HBL60505.1 formylglycine-generating enzyme family protein [Cyanobacteria bacterium UBA8803]
MIDKLIAILGSELEFTATEVADLLWLTLERHKRVNTVSSRNTPSNQESPQPPIELKSDQQIETDSTLIELTSLQRQPPQVEIYAATPSSTSDTTQAGYLPLSVPDARSVREPLDFIRALKPLLKKVASLTAQVIDEPATVDWIVQTDLWMPQLQPSVETWLELALVIDESESMILWRHAVKELQQILKHYGLFRDVRVWRMGRNAANQIYLRSQTRSSSAKELIDPQNRRLIMVVSDVTDDLWREAQMLSILGEWTASNPVVILQMLPAWMWSRTALRVGTPAQFRSSGLSILNPHLRVEVNRLAQLRNLAQGINLPVITLEPERAQGWSLMLGGQGEAQTTGYVLRQDLLAASIGVESAETPTAQERVSDFTWNASPLAQRLAGLLAAAPMITMPVVRLIQDSMLERSQQIQVAEVFLGGLLKPVGEITPATDPEQVQYEFIAGVRAELLKSVPVPDSEQVLDRVSRDLAKKLGKTLREFVAWLRDPTQIEDEAVASTIKPFAEVTQEILQQLGYEFAAEGDGAVVGGESEVLTLDTYNFEVVFIDTADIVVESLSQFNFQTVTVNRQGEIIKTENKTAQYLTEDLGNGITLDMVYIPGGTFWMGTEDEEIERLCKKYDLDYFRRERPRHQVTVSPFLMGKYPITQGQWQVVANMTHLKVERDLDPEPAYFKEDPPTSFLLQQTSDASFQQEFGGQQEFGEKSPTRWDRPVEQVSWYDAVEFCQRLSKLTGQEYRLPTEAEWEYACRAVTSNLTSDLPLTDEEREESYPPFHFGETLIDKLANYDASSTYAEEPEGEYRRETTPVGSFYPNAFGLYDMHGNVYEWCEDDYHDSYENAPTDGSAWLISDEYTKKILRGGCWHRNPAYCRCAYRGRNNPDIRNDDIGLRVVRAAARILP